MKGFTLFELIIALGLFTITITAGVVSLGRARNSVEMQGAYSDVFSYIRTLQNAARNSVAINNNGTNPQVPDFYTISFANNDYSLYYCDSTGATTANCTLEQQNLKSTRYGIYNLTSTCSRIGFSRTTGNIVSITNGGTVSDSNTTCTITLSRTVNSQVINKTIGINIGRDSFEYDD